MGWEGLTHIVSYMNTQRCRVPATIAWSPSEYYTIRIVLYFSYACACVCVCVCTDGTLNEVYAGHVSKTWNSLCELFRVKTN